MMAKLGKAKVGKEKGAVSAWRDVFGRPRPQIGALIGLATGGTHLVLHKLHGHPQIMALKQRALYPELKHYFGGGSYLMQDLPDLQLRPRKASLKELEWIFVNKPQMAFISNQYLFDRERIRSIYCFRNPIALFHSRAEDRMAFGERVHGRDLNWEDIAGAIAKEYRVSLASFAQVYKQDLDGVVNLESFAAQMDENLAALFNMLNVRVLKAADLALLEECEICGRSLERREGKVGKRREELLYCRHDDLFYAGPGGYNYIREVAPSKLASWKEKEYAEELQHFFSIEFGNELMSYFAQDRYLDAGGYQTFKGLLEDLLASYRRN